MIIDRLIANRFRINDLEKDLLGRGGMGDVYRAADTQTGETVAVKALNPEVVAHAPDLVERFVREGEALRQLNHPNIVRMIAAVQEQGQHYLIVEYVRGGSLADVLTAQGRLPSSRVIELALDLADALTRAHRLGIIHRDLKPANVLLAQDGTPRLADFGIAHVVSSPRLTQTGILIGTVDYLSPEICQGEPPDERADIWAFGVMLFQVLSGRLPFEGKSITAKLTAILTQPVPDLAQLTPDVPDALADLVYRMLEKDLQQRIPSVRLVGAELEAMLKGREPVTPSRVTYETRFAAPTPSVDAPKHNLPAQVTPFVGRVAELRELARLLTDPGVRLLSIVGMGGMGKTRLALEAGMAQVGHFEHGVYFVPLASLQSADAIAPTIAGALGLVLRESGEPRQQLLDHLRHKTMLIILDNLEHLLACPAPGRGDGVGLVSDIMRAATNVKVLATSRVRLSMQEEHLFHLAGMDFPDWETPADALEYSAVKLFLQSARRVRPGFELAADDLKYVARICRLAEGMPLGILLAAAWVEILTPQEIAAEMQRSLDFLATDLRDVPERQRSIRAVFDYAWNSLAQREREVFRALSVFRGGFAREAAQQVTGAGLRELMGLVNKSLLHRAPTGRYEIHELLRQYGDEKLAESAEADTIHQRHLEYHLALAEHSREAISGQRQAYWLHCLGVESDNLRAALDWCLASGNVQTGLRLAVCLRSFWVQRCLREGRDWLKRLLAAAPQPTLERATGLQILGVIAYNLGDYACASTVLEESLALFEAQGDLPAIADTTFRLAWPLMALGDLACSRRLLQRSLELYQDLSKPEQAAYVILWMGELARAEGDLARARELHEQSVALHRRLENKIRLSQALPNLGLVLIHFGELDRSQALFKEDLSIELELGTAATSLSFMGFACLANARGQPLRAVRLLGARDAMCKTTGQHVEAADRPDYERNLASLRAQLGEAAFEAAWAEGEAMTMEQAVELAMSDQPGESGGPVA